MFTRRVSEDKLIRLENLRRLCKDRSLGPRELEEAVGGRYTYWRDLLAGEKSFGEKAARKIEESLKLPRNWLDGGSHQPRSIDDLQPREVQLVMAYRRLYERAKGPAELGALFQLFDDLARAPIGHLGDAIGGAVGGVGIVLGKISARQTIASEGAEKPPKPTRPADSKMAPKRARGTTSRHTD
jgi:hypothetical protein